MCGIYGQVGANTVDVTRTLLAMSTAMKHRGPDDSGFDTHMYTDRHVGLGMNRLAIIDIGSGQQPIHSPDKQVTIVFNGEIYNYIALRKQLHDYPFQTQSDTETILALYLKHGTQCVDLLRGMFAFCIYDRRTHQVHLFRDHVGIKPLYWYHANGRFLFSSEITGITSVTSNYQLNTRAVLKYLTFRYVTGPDTIWTTIHSLPPGHFLTYDIHRHSTSLTRWWNLPTSPLHISYTDAKTRLAELLVGSVRDRLQSEVPLGAYLSGGVDSSLLSVIAQRNLDTPLNVYNIGYPDANEFEYALTLAKQHRLNYHQYQMREADVVDMIPYWIRHMDQPMCDPASIPTLYLSRYVTKRLTVMLSGEGADELFAGYWQYERELSKPETSYLSHLKGSSYFVELQGLVNSRHLTQYNPVADHTSLWDSRLSPVQRITKFDMDTWLCDNLLQKVDRMTMGASIEARVPFLDRDLLEFGFRLPDQFKWGQGNTKRILKDVAEELGVPRSITQRPKMGFTVPVRDLLRGVLRDDFDRARECVRQLPYIHAPVLEDKVARFYEGDDSQGLFAWNIFVLSLWLEYNP